MADIQRVPNFAHPQYSCMLDAKVSGVVTRINGYRCAVHISPVRRPGTLPKPAQAQGTTAFTQRFQYIYIVKSLDHIT